MSSEIIIEPLSAKAFAPFGDLIELADKPTMLINQGLCGRHHDLAETVIDRDGLVASVSQETST